MANHLKMAQVQAIQALRARGWSFRRIGRELGVHRETVARHVRLAEAESRQPHPSAEASGQNELRAFAAEEGAGSSWWCRPPQKVGWTEPRLDSWAFICWRRSADCPFGKGAGQWGSRGTGWSRQSGAFEHRQAGRMGGVGRWHWRTGARNQSEPSENGRLMRALIPVVGQAPGGPRAPGGMRATQCRRPW